ncbi:MAG: hypothetical protein QOE96_1080 [Blastocatellia bacterium]|jgi:hypothetical protein|nr:hypothetical protein [Blastocatellia bacterium]
MASRTFNMPASNGFVAISIDNIASVQDFGDRIAAKLIRPISIDVNGITRLLDLCEVTGAGVPSFRAWLVEHKRLP